MNDSMWGESGIEVYEESLDEIFKKINQAGAEAILLTPNMRTNHISRPFFEKELYDAVESVMKNENDGWLDKYLDTAREICRNQGVRICDCHLIWKKLTQNGVGVNNLLSNRVNHPTEEMHWLFAYELVRTIFEI